MSEERKMSTVSIMPQGLLSKLTKEEILDLQMLPEPVAATPPPVATHPMPGSRTRYREVPVR